jgi:hypothetical protein
MSDSHDLQTGAIEELIAMAEASTVMSRWLRLSEARAELSALLAKLRELEAEKAKVGELALLVRRLVRSLRIYASDSELAEQAADYLRRNNLQGSILRQYDKPSPTGSAGGET